MKSIIINLLAILECHFDISYVAGKTRNRFKCGIGYRYDPKTQSCVEKIYMCGHSFKSYKATTHECVNGTVVNKEHVTGLPVSPNPPTVSEPLTLVCGKNFVKYNTATHICEKGTVVKILSEPKILLSDKNQSFSSSTESKVFAIPFLTVCLYRLVI